MNYSSSKQKNQAELIVTGNQSIDEISNKIVDRLPNNPLVTIKDPFIFITDMNSNKGIISFFDHGAKANINLPHVKLSSPSKLKRSTILEEPSDSHWVRILPLILISLLSHIFKYLTQMVQKSLSRIIKL